MPSPTGQKPVPSGTGSLDRRLVSPMAQKFHAAQAAGFFDSPPQPWEIAPMPPKYPKYFFFYGTLKEPKQLRHVLDLSNSAELEYRKAEIIGFELEKWGDYLALIDGPPGHAVEGLACLIHNEEQAHKLAVYETSAYKQAPCRITFGDRAQVSGYTFMYAGDAEALKVGRFDRKLWERQMGMGLNMRHAVTSAGASGSKDSDR